MPDDREAGGNPLDFVAFDHVLSEDERARRDAVRSFVAAEVAPEVTAWFERGEVPADLMQRLGELGLLGMNLQGYGCPGESDTAYGLACMELEAGDSGIRNLASVQGSLSMFAIWRWGSEEQKEDWLPRMARGETVGCFGLTEAGAGSDAAALECSAREDGGDWVIDGEKLWISNARIADVAVVWAKTEDGLRGFLVPTDADGFTVGAPEHLASLRTAAVGHLRLEGVRVPGAAMLPAVKSLKGPLSCLNESRYGIVWGAAGAARACLETALAYSLGREQFGRPIGGFQIQQQRLATMALEAHRAALVALHMGRAKEAGELGGEHLSLGKMGNVDAALAVAREARALLGANGVSLDHDVIRHLLNLESVVTYEGTSDLHALIVGGAMTGIQAFR